MEKDLRKEITEIADASLSLGDVGLAVFETQKDFEKNAASAEKTLAGLGYEKLPDYVALMEGLAAGKPKLLYVEHNKKLDGSVLEIIAEFDAGIVSLADRKNNTGLKTATWNPVNTSLIVFMSRKQVEASYPRLFEYISLTKSV